nr:MAG TPA: hypothetical protein [Caudoviricetes sp.]
MFSDFRFSVVHFLNIHKIQIDCVFCALRHMCKMCLRAFL